MSNSQSDKSGHHQQDTSSWRRRHDPHIIARLEEVFKDCMNPDETRRRQLGEELGMDPQQVKFWFQNKKTQMRNKNERLDTHALRVENQTMESENNAMRERLQNLSCRCCGLRSMEALKMENTILTNEFESVRSFLEERGIDPALLPTLSSSSSHHVSAPTHDHDHIPNLVTPAIDQNIPALNDPALSPEDSSLIPGLDHNVAAFVTALDQNLPPIVSPHDQHNNIPSVETKMDSALMSNIAEDAMEELIKLVRLNEPFWFRSIINGRFALQREFYKMIFDRTNCFTGPHARNESSKDSRVVKMGGTQLVEMFLNSDKWVDLFPTIVKKAQTIQVFESGSLENRNGTLKLMNVELHTLSHLVPTRKFLFLRYCKQIEVGVWAIGDVSVDSSTYETTVCNARKFPSGCVIQEMSEGLCNVSWVEHVEVDDKIQIHQLFENVICGNYAYGAERWAMTLERMCERFASASNETIPSAEAGGVIKSCDGRKNIMHLTNRMIKSFVGNLDVTDNTNFPNLTRMNDGGVKISVRTNRTEPDVPKGMIISGSTCFQLPCSPNNIFVYLTDNMERPKWDTLCNGCVGHEIQNISTGSNPGNNISIMRQENNLVILQESYEDALGSMLVFAPLDMKLLKFAMEGFDASLFPILPSGLIIYKDAESDVSEGQFEEVRKSGGSLVTLMLQLFVSSPSEMDNVDIGVVVDSVHTLVTTTAERIKTGLNCYNFK